MCEAGFIDTSLAFLIFKKCSIFDFFASFYNYLKGNQWYNSYCVESSCTSGHQIFYRLCVFCFNNPQECMFQRLSDTVVRSLLHIFAHFSLDLEDLLIATFYFARCIVDMLLVYALHIFHIALLSFPY